MQLQLNTAYSQKIYALQNKESQTPTKETTNNALKNQSASYDMFVQKSEAARLIEEAAKAEELAKKIARGDSITSAEKEFLNTIDPKLVAKAEAAQREAERLKERLEGASDSQEVKKIMAQVSSELNEIAETSPQDAAILAEAMDKAYREHMNEAGYTPLEITQSGNDIKVEAIDFSADKGKLLDMRA